MVFDNRRLGMVREYQNSHYARRHIATHMDGNPDFVALCQAYGIPAALAKNNREAEQLAQEMLQSPGPMCWCAGWTRKRPRCERKGYSMKYTLSVLVENQPGVLSKVVSLFARRGYNIDSLAVGTTEDPTMSRMTIVGQGTTTSWSRWRSS